MIYAKILRGIFVVAASYIFRHVGLVLLHRALSKCCQNASANKIPVKIRAVLFSSEHSSHSTINAAKTPAVYIFGGVFCINSAKAHKNCNDFRAKY